MRSLSSLLNLTPPFKNIFATFFSPRAWALVNSYGVSVLQISYGYLFRVFYYSARYNGSTHSAGEVQSNHPMGAHVQRMASVSVRSGVISSAHISGSWWDWLLYYKYAICNRWMFADVQACSGLLRVKTRILCRLYLGSGCAVDPVFYAPILCESCILHHSFKQSGWNA